MALTAEVVIIGGGAIGTSIAYHLAKLGCRDVVLVERDFVGSGATSKAVGGVRSQFSTAEEIRLSQESAHFFAHFQEEMGVPCDYRQTGYLYLISDQADLEHFQEATAFQRGLGVDVRMISPGEAGELVPHLRVDDLLAAVFCPTDGYAGPSEVVQAFASQARRLGVRIMEESEAVAITLSRGRVTGVATTRGRIDTRLVVNAAGPQASLVARMVGVELPVHARRRHIFVTEPFLAMAYPTPLTTDRGTGFYFRTDAQRVLMSPGDAGEVEDLRCVAVEWGALEETVAKAVRRVPALADATVASGWAGLRPLTLDDHAIVDYAPGVAGLLCAVGFGGHGFMHSPAVGRLVAEWMVDASRSPDLLLFAFGRPGLGRSPR